MKASLRAVFAGLRRGFNEGAGHERVLLYSSLLLLLVMKRYALSLDALVYQEFFLVCILLLALVALAVELWKGGSLGGAVCQRPEFRQTFQWSARRLGSMGALAGAVPSEGRVPPAPALGEGAGLVGRNGETWIWVLGALLLVWSVASVFWSPSPYWGWYWAGSWLGCLVYGGLLSLAVRRESFRGAFLGVVLAGFGMLCVAAIGQYYLGGFAMRHWGGLSRLQAAEVLAMFLPLTAGLFLFHPLRLWRGLGLVCFGLFFWVMLQTGERSPMLGLWAAVLVGGVGLVWLSRRERAGLGKDGAAAVLSRPVFRRLGLIVLLAEAMTLVQTRPTLFNGWNTLTLADRLQPEAVMDQNLQARFQYWAACGEMFKANPLAGQGAGSFRSGYRHYRGLYFQDHLPWGYFMNDEDYTPARAHNQYFQVLGELGLVGLVLLGLFLAAVLWTPLRRLAGGGPNAGGANQRRRQLLALCCVLGLVVFCVSAAASSFGFHMAVSAWGFWVLLGLALAWSRPGAGSETQGPPLKAGNHRSQVEGGALGETGDVSLGAPVAAGWFPRSGPGVWWGARMALLAGLGVTAAMGYASFRMVMSDFQYGLFCFSGTGLSHLEAALAWQPQNPSRISWRLRPTSINCCSFTVP